MSADAVRRNSYGQPIGEEVGDISARRPGAVTLTGRTCRIEPLTPDHAAGLLDSLRRGAGDEQWTYLPYGPCADVAAYTEVVQRLAADPDAVAYVILDPAGAPVGTASLMRINAAIATIEVGHIMYGDGARRAAPATEAMYLLARYAFDDLGYRRYEWKCDDLHALSRAAAERLGFTYEGTWRKALAYKGRNRDTAWYAMTDDDWARVRPAYDAWLAGLDDEGRQSAPLAAREALAR